jgi:hypothetical protein
MKITQTQTQWGNLYRKRWYMNGKRISESLARYYLDRHAWEHGDKRHGGGVYRYDYYIGPPLDAPSLMDHPDMA